MQPVARDQGSHHVGRWFALSTLLVALAVSFLPITPTGSTASCGNAFDAATASTGGGNGTVPTIGQLCHPLGTGRLTDVAWIVVVGLLVSAILGFRRLRRG